MKEQILSLLKAGPDYISGEEISRRLGISRTAVWKHINTLKEDGYSIDSQTKIGYRLLGTPDKLYPAEIKEFLQTKNLGREIYYSPSVDSTNRAARDGAEKGAIHGTVFVAEEQTAGKGRLGRQWQSPIDTGIWMSVILRPEINPADAPKITLTAAAAVAGALADQGLRPGIKWPNDILLEGKKVCGILTEMKADMDRVHYVVVGIGVNVNDSVFPDELREIATSLRLTAGRVFHRGKMTAALLGKLEDCYQRLMEEGFAGVREDWKRFSVNLGREVTVTTLKEVILGTAVDIDENGLLLVRSADGQLQPIIAGDVTLRKE